MLLSLMDLYLLKFKGQPDRFKIGKGESAVKRIVTLQSPKMFDLENSIVVTGKKPTIERLERDLHDLFSPYNIEHTGLTSGNTEIFDVKCWDQVVAEVDRRIDQFPHLGLEKKGIEIEKTPIPRAKNREYRSSKIEITGLREMMTFISENAEDITIYKSPQGHIRAMEATFHHQDFYAKRPPLPPAITVYGRKGVQMSGGGNTLLVQMENQETQPYCIEFFLIPVDQLSTINTDLIE